MILQYFDPELKGKGHGAVSVDPTKGRCVA